MQLLLLSWAMDKLEKNGNDWRSLDITFSYHYMPNSLFVNFHIAGVELYW